MAHPLKKTSKLAFFSRMLILYQKNTPGQMVGGGCASY